MFRRGETLIFTTRSAHGICQDRPCSLHRPPDRTWPALAAQQNCSELRNSRQNLLPAPMQPFRRQTSQKPSVFTGVIGQNARRTPLFATPFGRANNDFEGTPRRPSPACPPTSGCRHLRGPTWHPKTPNMQLPPLFTAQNSPHAHKTTIKSQLWGAPGPPADRPRATSASVSPAARSPSCGANFTSD